MFNTAPARKRRNPSADGRETETRKEHIMKKQQFISIAVLLSLLWGLAPGSLRAQNSISYTSTSATIKFNIAGYSFETSDVNQLMSLNGKSFIKIVMDDDEYGIVADEGYPAIPQLPLLINIPVNAKNVSVSMRNSITDLRQIPADEYIEPFVNIGKDGTVEGTAFNADYYRTATTPYVSYRYVTGEPFSLMGEQALDLTILPFLYVPTTGRLSVLQSAEFVITWTLEGSAAKSPISQARESFFEDVFMSYTGNAPKSGKKGKLLIITAPQYEQGLTLFKQYKENIGIETSIVSTATTGKSVGEIATYIEDNASKTDFVLLVGSINDIPITSGNTSGNDKNNPATDYGYRNFKDNKYGNVFLGRWPVKSKADLANITNKTIIMESTLSTTPRNVYILSGHDVNPIFTTSFNKGNNAAMKGLGKYSYKCDTFYQSSQERINSLSYSFPAWFIYGGHGVKNRLAYFNRDDESAISFTFFKRQDMFPFTFAFSCQTGSYYQTNKGEGMALCILKSLGPVSYFGSTVNTTNTSDEVIEQKIALSLGQVYIGSIITSGMTKYFNQFWSSKPLKIERERYAKAYNLMGDPSLNRLGYGVQSTYNFDELLTAVGGINLTFSSTDAININQGLRMESGATLAFKPANTLLFKGSIATANGRLTGESKKITLDGGARINSGSVVNLTANEFDFKPGFTIEGGSDVIFQVK